MKVVFVVGPTACGKSARSLRWAQKFGGVIVNCDSIQCYQSLDIGSAKPSLEERSILPHYLFDYIPEGETLTAGTYSRDFSNLMTELEKKKVPLVLVVGGTGFYFQAIEKGMYSGGAADPKMIEQLENQLVNQGAEVLWRELAGRDADSAARISIQDHYRLVRAIEMMRTQGKTPTEARLQFEAQQKPFPYPLLKIGVTARREELLPLVQRRTRGMLQRGLLEEVEKLIVKGLKDWSPLSSVGYKECVDYLTGLSVAGNSEELANLIGISTLQLAKKQRTWFQRDLSIHWLPSSAAAESGDELLSHFRS